MRWRINWITVALTLGVAAGVALLAGTVFVWSGVYNIAASNEHFGITRWLLKTVREQSIDLRTAFLEPPRLADEGLVRLGAAHYEGGCVLCHNRPGEPLNPLLAGMLPVPPDLAHTAQHRSAEEMFWIVRHGLKYTGMPAWSGEGREDEVWAVAAFLNELPMSEERYLDLAGIPRTENGQQEPTASDAALRQCGRCHETADAGTNGDAIPRLSVLPRAYIARSLREYREGSRASGVMEPVAAPLDAASIDALADYFAALEPRLENRDTEADPDRLEQGAILAGAGMPEQGIPACLGCHSGTGAPEFPTLAGQHADYIAGQLRLWKRGERQSTAYGRIMAVIARRLSGQQISDVSLYLSTMAPATGRARGYTQRVEP